MKGLALMLIPLVTTQRLYNLQYPSGWQAIVLNEYAMEKIPVAIAVLPLYVTLNYGNQSDDSHIHLSYKKDRYALVLRSNNMGRYAVNPNW